VGALPALDDDRVPVQARQHREVLDGAVAARAPRCRPGRRRWRARAVQYLLIITAMRRAGQIVVAAPEVEAVAHGEEPERGGERRGHGARASSGRGSPAPPGSPRSGGRSPPGRRRRRGRRSGAPHQPAGREGVVHPGGVEDDGRRGCGSRPASGPTGSPRAPSNSISPVGIERVPSLSLSRRSGSRWARRRRGAAPGRGRGRACPRVAPSGRALTTNSPASATEQNHFSPLMRHLPGRCRQGGRAAVVEADVGAALDLGDELRRVQPPS
jgi:hypothetical protein